jgi:hypothetical protein
VDSFISAFDLGKIAIITENLPANSENQPASDKEDKTLTQFIREHPTIIYDLTTAAIIIKMACGNKKNHLTDYLLTITDELKPYDFFKTLTEGHAETEEDDQQPQSSRPARKL